MNQPGQMTMGGPVNAPTPNGGGAPLGPNDVLERLNTAIYDYLLRNQHYEVARAVSKHLAIRSKDDVKQSPNQRNGQEANGADDGMEVDGIDKGISNRPKDLPFPDNVVEGPFLQDWWFQFWEIHFAKRGKNPNPHTNQYIAQQRMQQKARMGIMGGGMDPASMQNLRGYNGMVQGMNNGIAGMPNDLKRTAMQNQRNMTPHQMAAIKNMQGGQQMQGTQMERSGSQMDTSGPRSGSPGSGDAPSPKRPRLEGGNMQQMNQGRPGQPGQMQGNQVGPSDIPSDPGRAHTHELMLQYGLDPAAHPDVISNLCTKPTNVQVQNLQLYSQSINEQSKQQMETSMNKSQSNTQKGMPPNMGPGAQGSPMSQQGMDGATPDFYAAANARMPMQANNPQAVAAAAAAGQGNNNGNHALQDYQMQLMLLEQQNKKRLLMARQEQDSMAHPGAQPNGQFPPGASPQGIQRAGNPSPNPSDMQRGMMDPSQVPPNVRAQMMQNGHMMRPPSSHPMGQMPPGQQMEMMRQQGQMVPNGNFPPGQQPPGGMMPGQQGPNQQQPMGTPRQQNSNMPPPPAPAANSSGTGPSSPSQQSAAPPTPSQTNKPKPGGKNEPKKKGAANKKGGAAPNATPASESEQPPTPTPATPITPMNPNSFGKGQSLPNGQAAAAQQANAQAHGQNQQQQQQNAVQPAAAGGQPDMNAPFGSLENNQFADMNLDFTLEGGDVLDNFDFDSFLNESEGDAFAFDANLAFGDGLDTGIENAN